jgi:hypothetical protein
MQNNKENIPPNKTAQNQPALIKKQKPQNLSQNMPTT